MSRSYHSNSTMLPDNWIICWGPQQVFLRQDMADWIPCTESNHLPRSIQKIKLFIVLCCGKSFCLSVLVCNFLTSAVRKQCIQYVSHLLQKGTLYKNMRKKTLLEKDQGYKDYRETTMDRKDKNDAQRTSNNLKKIITDLGKFLKLMTS